MPVYSPPPISPSITDGRSVQMSPAAVIMTRAAAAAHTPPEADGTSENVSPSVIWVGSCGLSTPSAAAASQQEHAAAASQQEYAAVDAGPRLRDMLEASLHSHGDGLAVGENRWEGRERGSVQSQLETEIALMQVRACSVRAIEAATVTLARQGWLKAKEAVGVRQQLLEPARQFLQGKVMELRQVVAADALNVAVV
jgi:hypothetical protein